MRDKLAVTAAVGGSLLVWPCLLAPFAFAGLGMASGRSFNFDFLLPLELFPFVLIGGCVLLLGAQRVGLRHRTIATGFGLTGGFLILSQVFAIVSGLASGKTEASSWQGAVLGGFLVAYMIGLAILFAGGILLLLDLARHSSAAESPA